MSILTLLLEEEFGVAMSVWDYRLIATGDSYHPMYANVCLINELELFASVDASGVDLTTGKIATASSFVAPYVASNAVDNNAVTLWHSALNDPARSWLQVAGVAGDVKSLAVTYQANNGSSHAALQRRATGSADAWVTIGTIVPANVETRQVFTNLA